jgi:tripartite-type tricarboxylate transporter receptor subunit TctC
VRRALPPLPPGERIGARGWFVSAFAAVVIMLAAHAALAADDAVASFYKGRTIQLYIGYSPGGGYDTYARVLARHMGEHIPGNPTIVPQNMPGAGSLRATNYLYAIAPKDGTAIATFARGMAMQPLLDPTGTQYDSRKLTWLGSITDEVSICAFRTAAGIKTLDDMKTKSFTVGGTGSGSDTDIFAEMLRNLFHMKMKIATGYPGGSDVVLAIERGEVDGRCGWSWSSVLARSKALLDDKKIDVTLQFALAKHEDLPNVPLVFDLTQDPKQIAAMKLIVSRNAVARPYAAPPGIPADRKAALRAAFDATMKDPAFLDEAKRSELEVRPVNGEAVDKIIAEIYASPPDVVAIAKAAIKEGETK